MLMELTVSPPSWHYSAQHLVQMFLLPLHRAPNSETDSDRNNTVRLCVSSDLVVADVSSYGQLTFHHAVNGVLVNEVVTIAMMIIIDLGLY
jgi:hypothetical protein